MSIGKHLKLRPIGYPSDAKSGAGIVVASKSGELKGKVYFIGMDHILDEDLKFVYIDGWIMCLSAYCLKSLGRYETQTHYKMK